MPKIHIEIHAPQNRGSQAGSNSRNLTLSTTMLQVHMLDEILQVHGQPRDVISSPGLVRVTMSTEVWDEDEMGLCESVDVALEDCSGACEAV